MTKKYRDLKGAALPLSFYKYVIPLSRKIELDAIANDKFNTEAYRKFRNPKQAERYAKRRYVRWRCREDLIYLAKCLGYPQWGSIHYFLADWLKNTRRSNESYTRAIMMFRGVGKSTLGNRIDTIQKWLINPNLIILQQSGKWDAAKDAVFKPLLENICQRDGFLQTFFPDIFGSENIKYLDTLKWRTNKEFNISGFDTIYKREMVGQSCTFGTLDKDPTGTHPNVIKLDDCVIPENVQTEKSIEKTKSSIGLLNGLLTPPFEKMVIGTIYKSTDYYWSTLLPNLVGQEWFQIKNNIYPFVNDKLFWVPAEYFEPSTGELIYVCPERFGKEFLALQRQEMGEDDYRTQYLMQPADSKGSFFPLSYSDADRCKYVHTDLYGTAGNMKTLHKVLYIDPAGSGNVAPTSSDFSAIVVAGMDSDEKVYVLDYWQDQNQSYGQIAQAAWQMAVKHSPNLIAFEKNISNELYNSLEREKDNITQNYPSHIRQIPICSRSHTGSSKASKVNRIRGALQDKWLHGKLKFLDEHQAILEQVINYGGKDTLVHDDLIDALAGAVTELVPPPPERNPFYTYTMEQEYEQSFDHNITNRGVI